MKFKDGKREKLRFKGFIEKPKVRYLKELSIDGIKNGVMNKRGKSEHNIKFINVINLYHDDYIDVEKLEDVDVPFTVLEKYRVLPFDIFFTRSSLTLEGIAHCNINLEDKINMVFDDHLMRIRPKTDIVNPYFLKTYCLTRQSRKFFMSRAKTATMTTIGQEDISFLPINLPAIEEQDKIASFFRLLNLKLEWQQEKTKQLELLKKGMVQKIFSQEIRFNDNNISEYPKWKETKLSNICDFKTGKSKNNFLDENGKYYVMDMGAVSEDGRIISKKKVLSSDDLLNVGDLIMPKDDIGGGKIIGKTAYIGESNKYVLGDHVYLIKVKETECHPLFAHYQFNSPNFNRKIKRLVTGSAQLGITAKNIIEEYILLPSLEEQRKIASYLNLLDNKIDKEKEKLNVLQQHLKGFLQMMF